MNIILGNEDANNEKQIELLHPEVKILFAEFVLACKQAGVPVWIYSGFRSFELQATLRTRYETGLSEIPAARAGRSYHNYGLAIDIYVYNEKLKKFDRGSSFDIYKKIIAPIAKKFGLRWLGGKLKVERHHFDYNKIKVKDLLEARDKGKLDEKGFVIFDEVQDSEVEEVKEKTFDIWQTDIGKSYIEDIKESEEPEEKVKPRKITRIEKLEAVGIWKRIKLVADQYSLSQSINDATIATSQGSLMNYITNVVQKPWLQFWGDTSGSNYYFNVRKEPFDYNGWTSLPNLTTFGILERDVLSDDLAWYNGEIYSWYQIIPRGSFLGEQNLIFAYITAVYFEEYAEIWGSKPNIQVSNYVNFTKIRGKSTMNAKALEDLRYMVESNAYLPFTRQGTITIKGNTTIKRGYKIFYFPTGEEFYVDSVTHNYSISDGGTDFVTILQVSRGMKREFTAAPKSAETNSYFNLIIFDKPDKQTVEVDQNVDLQGGYSFYFDNDRSYLIDLNEVFKGKTDTVSRKMQEQIEEFPNLRVELDEENDRSLQKTLKLIKDNPDADIFVCKGYIDSDSGANFKALAENRAITVKSYIIEQYLLKYNNYTKEDLESKFRIEFDVSGQFFYPLDGAGNTLDSDSVFKIDNERNLKLKAYERYSTFRIEPYTKKVKKEIQPEGINWRVNDKVFQFFVNRKQFAN